MKKQTFTCLIFIITAMVFIANSVLAQQTDLTENPPISPEKKALIQELREVMGLNKFAINIDHNSVTFDTATSAIDKDPQLSATQKDELRKFALEIEEKTKQAIISFSADPANSSQLFENVSIEMFNQNFTTDEIKEMVVFFKTSAGKKSVNFLTRYAETLTKTFMASYRNRYREFMKKKLTEMNEMIKQKTIEIKSPKLEA